MKRFFLAFVVFVTTTSLAIPISPKVVSDEVIWQNNKYLAFTSLVYYKKWFYCAFREANGHTNKAGNGIIRIIKSKDGRKWSEFKTLEIEGVDLRDPKLCIDPHNRLMLSCGGTEYDGSKVKSCCTRICFLNKMNEFTPFEKVDVDGKNTSNWIWRIVWHKGIAYGFNYINGFAFLKSADGVHYRTSMKHFSFKERPTEADFVIEENDSITIVLRNGSVCQLGFGRIEDNISWHEFASEIGGPSICKVGKYFYVGSRMFLNNRAETVFAYIADSGKLHPLISFPSKKDCSYPGVVYRKGKVYMTYYNGDGYSSTINMAIMKL